MKWILQEHLNDMEVTVVRVSLCMVFGLVVSACSSSPRVVAKGLHKLDLPRFTSDRPLPGMREHIDTDAPILFLRGDGVPLNWSGTNPVSSSQFAAIRDNMRIPYCTIFCERTQSLGKVVSAILQPLFQPNGAMVVGVGFVIVVGAETNAQRVVLDVEIGLGQPNTTNQVAQTSDDTPVRRVHVMRNIVEDDRHLLIATGKPVADNKRVIAEFLDPSLSVQEVIDVIGRYPVLRSALLEINPKDRKHSAVETAPAQSK